MKKITPVHIAALVAFIVVVSNSVFILDQRQQALVLQFGNLIKSVSTPGLNFKAPLIQNVIYFDKRILDLNADPKEVIASDQKRLIVDAFAKYQIIDPLKFYQTVRDEAGARNRLNSLLDSSLRQVLGSYRLSGLITSKQEEIKRPEIMQKITNALNSQASGFGIKIVDVRIMRADLPQKNSEAIYLRMQTEREREAKQFRAEGAEEAQRIRSGADKERTVILADAQKKAQITRGEGEGEAAKIYADAFGKDPEFSSFYRTMQAYRESITKDDTTIVISPKNQFLKYFE